MILKKTVLVLGAGASVDYGFPLGYNLKTEIIRNLSRTQRINEIAACVECSFEDIRRFNDQLANFGCKQLTAFLGPWKQNSIYQNIGKTAIAQALIPFEDVSKFNPVESTNWYQYFFERLKRSADNFEDLKRNQLSVITFNYDRSLEYFLFNSIRNLYGRNETDTALLLNEIPIIHVHGTLSWPHWRTDKQNIRPYSSEYNAISLKNASESMLVIHAADENTSEFKQARNLIKHAEEIIFLGFGYDDLNLRRLGVAPIPKREGERNVHCSCFEMNKPDCERIKLLILGNNNEVDLNVAFSDPTYKAYNFISNIGIS